MSGPWIPHFNRSTALAASEVVTTQIILKKRGFQAKEKLARGLLKKFMFGFGAAPPKF
jgi:hypothetical protein